MVKLPDLGKLRRRFRKEASFGAWFGQQLAAVVRKQCLQHSMRLGNNPSGALGAVLAVLDQPTPIAIAVSWSR